MTMTIETFEILMRYHIKTFTWYQQCVNKECPFPYIRHLLSLNLLGTSKTSCVLYIHIQKHLKFEHISRNIQHIFYSIYQFNSSCTSVSDIKHFYKKMEIMKVYIMNFRLIERNSFVTS